MAEQRLSAIQQSFRENLGAWIFGLLIAVSYWGYSTQRDLSEVCDLAQGANEITAPAPLDENGKSISPTDGKALLADLKRIETEHTVDGELWRWQQFEGDKIEKICAPSVSD